MNVLWCAGVALAVYMTLLFVVATVRKNNGTADIGYGVAGIVAVGAAYALTAPTWYASLLYVLTCVWGVRLALRIFFKNRGKPEDFRYRAWREAWGRTFLWRSFLQIYILQGLIVFLVVLPVMLALVYPSELVMPLFVLGVGVWLVGFVFEVVGDAQLDVFLKNPNRKGTIMKSGLWRYSRHPNYFGESLMWWGMALAASAQTSLPLLGFVSPVLITYLLLRVSGVPMLERKWAGNPEWEEYKARTSVFIPLPPR